MRKQEWQNKLLQDRILIRHNPAWPSTNLVKCPQVPDICIYRLNDHSLRILLSAGSLFDWNYPYLPEDISFLDPCMGSGHILVYAFDIFMEIYKEKGYIRLQPENSTMDPIIVPNCQILGKVAGVFRKM